MTFEGHFSCIVTLFVQLMCDVLEITNFLVSNNDDLLLQS